MTNGTWSFRKIDKEKNYAFSGAKDTIRCECGEEILILPDVRATGAAIEGHIALHLKGVKGPVYRAADAERLRDFLIMQVLRVAGDSEDKKTNK